MAEGGYSFSPSCHSERNFYGDDDGASIISKRSPGRKRNKQIRRNRHTVTRPRSEYSCPPQAFPNRPQQFETCLYIEFTGEHSPGFDIDGYIADRTGGSFDFNIIRMDINAKLSSTLLTVSFSSKRKALKAMDRIHGGNDNSSTEINCYLHESDLIRDIAHKEDKIKQFSLRQTEEVSAMSQKLLKSHDYKLKTLKQDLGHINKLIKKRGFMLFDQFQIADAEKKAITDKIREMELQRKEYDAFTTDILWEMKLASDTKEFKGVITDLRRDFDIECTRMTECLPLYARRTEIVKTVYNSRVSIIIGETGSGKSTQMAQYLYEAGLGNTGIIACTQPRKIAAINLANHVSKQLVGKLGDLVGYQCGMNVKRSCETKILYMTDHALLNECLKDPNLLAYSCIIIDEAHERSIFTDLLIGMLKKCLPFRPDLHNVITSATINPEIFISFFGPGTPALSVSGRAYPVEVIWDQSSDEEFKDYQQRAVDKAINIHNNELSGHILVFLTTPLEVERCCDMFKKHYNRQKKYVCLQLHGKISAEEQQKVFKEFGNDTRKIIFATNAAETSITIPNVKYVVDTGLVKEMNYDAKRSLNSLTISMTTQSSAQQRTGRAGRTTPGKCYRLYTKDTFNEMRQNSVPEILRIHLGHAVLKLLQLGVEPKNFDFVESPSRDALDIAIESLENLNAVIDGVITSLGRWLAKLPLDPHFGAFLYYAIQNGVGMEALVIASTCCSPGSVFFRAGSDEEKDNADKLKARFCRPGGDLLTNLQVYREWSQQPEHDKTQWCLTNSLNAKSLRGIRETVNEILKLLKMELKINLTAKLDCFDLIEAECKLQKLLFRIFHANLCYFLGFKKAGYLFIEKEQQVHLFPSSALLALGSWPEWITFIQVMQTSRQFAMNVLPVNEADVIQAVDEGWLELDIECVKKKRLKVACETTVGKSTYNEFVGPRHSFLKKLENEFKANYDGSIAIIDADRDEGMVKVYCIEEHTTSISEDVEEYTQAIRTKYKQEKTEGFIGQEGSGVRAILRAGGDTANILMTDEYVTVQVFTNAKKEIRTPTADDIMVYFGKFGNIESCNEFNFRNKPKHLWGTVTFISPLSAKRAIESKLPFQDFYANLRNSNISSSPSFQLSAKITWERRQSKGFGFVEFRDVEQASKARKGRMQIAGSMSNIKKRKNSDDKLNEVYVGGLNKHVTEDVLRDEIARNLELNPENDILSVHIVRNKVRETDAQMHSFRRRLIARLEGVCENVNAFQLTIVPPSFECYNYEAYANFRNAEDGHMACQQIHGTFTLNNRLVHMVPQLKARISIHSVILQSVNEQLETLLNSLEARYNILIKKDIQQNGNLLIEIFSQITKDLNDAKSHIESFVKGESVEFENESQVNQCFTWDGAQTMKSIEAETGSTIILDRRMYSVTLHGTSEQRNFAKVAISTYLDNSANRQTRQLKLSGPDKPIGVMRALLIKYGCDLIDLKVKSKLQAIDLHFRSHTLNLVGDQEALSGAVQLVEELIDSLRKDQNACHEEVEI